jgi:hypothetical protein
MSRSARLRVCAGDPASVRAGPPHITASIGRDLLAPASDDDEDEPYEIGLPAAKKVVIEKDEEEAIEEDDDKDDVEDEADEVQEEEETQEEDKVIMEEKAIVIEDDGTSPVVSLPADSPLLFVPVTPKNSLLVTDEEEDVDREMEIVEETPKKDEAGEDRKGKEPMVKTNVTFSSEKKTKKEGNEPKGS